MSERLQEVKEEPSWEADTNGSAEHSQTPPEAQVKWDPGLGEPQPSDDSQIEIEFQNTTEGPEDSPNEDNIPEVPVTTEDVTPDPLDLKMKIPENKCFLCDSYLDGNVVQVGSRGIRSFIAASQKRADGKEIYFRNRTSLRVHSKCRNLYTNEKCIIAYVRKLMKDVKQKFDFKSYCVICAEAAGEEFVKAQFALPAAQRRATARVDRPELQGALVRAAAVHDDQWSRHVVQRVDKADLCKERAVYHADCLAKFTSPRRAEPSAAAASLVRRIEELAPRGAATAGNTNRNNPENKCFFCDSYLDRDVVQVGSKGISSLIAASQKRADGKEIYFQNRTSLRVHAKCRKLYTNPKCINAYVKRLVKDVKKFDFKSYCVICAEAAGEEFVKAQFALPAAQRRATARVDRPELQSALVRAAAVHDDQWSRHVVQLIDKADLCKERAVYHEDCLAKFTSPRRAEPSAAAASLVRRIEELAPRGAATAGNTNRNNSTKCLICHLPIDSDATSINEHSLPYLLEASQQRGDGEQLLFKLEDELILQGKCHRACIDSRAVSEYQPRVVATFDFKNNCMICGGDAGEEFAKKQSKLKVNKRSSTSRVTKPDTQSAILKAAATHNDEWSHEVLRRIHNVNLQEQNAVYHHKCYVKFAHPYRAQCVKRGRNLLPETSEALQHVCEFLESYTEDCQLSADEMRKALPNIELPSNRCLIYNLKRKYGDDMVVSRRPPAVSLITRCHIQDKWYAAREENDANEKLRIIDMAARIIVEDIQSRVCDNEAYPSAAGFLDGAEDDCPETLLRLLRAVIVGNKPDPEPFERKSVALTHAVLSAARPKSFKSPVLLGLSAMIRQKYSSRHLVDVLSGLGFGASYDETLRFEASALTAYETRSSKHQPQFAQYVFEATGETLMGIQCTNPPAKTLNEKIPRLKRIPSSFPKRIEQIPTLTYSEPPNCGLENIAFTPPTENEGFPLGPPDLLCMLAKSNKLPNIPGCNYFMCLKGTENKKSSDVLASEVKPTPFISSGSSFDKVLTALDFAVKQCKLYKLDCCIVTFDQPLYHRAQEIVKSSEDPDISSIVLRLGAGGLLKSFLGATGKIMNGSGLEDLWASIYTKDSIDPMMSGQHWERAVRAHWLTSLALFDIITKQVTFDLQENMELERSLFVLVDGKLLDIDNSVAESIIKKITDSLNVFEQRGPTSALWASYFKMAMIIQGFIRAERTGDWGLHLSCVRKMLPYLHAAGNFEYAKAAAMYLRDMESLEETMSLDSYQKFITEKLFTIRMTKELGNDIFCDGILQRNSLSKNESIPARDSLKNWALGLPVLHCVSEIMENFSNHTDAVAGLKDGTKARILKDDNDLQLLLKWFEDHDPFPYVPDIMCISNRLNGGIDTNPQEALKIGQDIMTKRTDTSFAEIKYSRTETIQSLATLTSAIALHKVNVPVDSLMILRSVSRLKKSAEEMSGYLQYELAPYPLSLFDRNGMRRINKSKFYQMYEATDYEGGEGAHIVDGTLLLRAGDAPFSLAACVDQVKQYSNPTVVFEGYSSENCVKTQETLRTEDSLESVEFYEDTNVDPKKFLSSYKNRGRLIEMLVQHLNAEDIQTVQCTGVADTTIVSIAVAMASEKLYSAVTIVSDNVDVLAVLTSKHSEDVSVLRPGSKGTPSRQYEPTSFNGDPSVALVAHAFTGCDTTSAIYKRGKTLACSKILDDPDSSRKLSVFKDPLAKTKDIIKAGEALFCRLHDAGKTKLKDLRYEEFARSFTKCERDLAALPPTVAAARQHSLRVYHQVQKWTGNELDPTEWGWERRAPGLRPITTLDDLVPRELLKVIACTCKGSCEECRCAGAGRGCGALCRRCADRPCRRPPAPAPAPDLDDDVELHMDRLELDESDDVVSARYKRAKKRKLATGLGKG